MVKRKTKRKTRRSKQKGVSMIGLAETYLLMNVATQAMFRTNPVNFLVGEPLAGSANITLREILTPQGKGFDRFYDNPSIGAGELGAGTYIMRNIRANGFNAAIQFVTIPLAFKFGKEIAKPAISRTNRLLAKGNIANTVKL